MTGRAVSRAEARRVTAQRQAAAAAGRLTAEGVPTPWDRADNVVLRRFLERGGKKGP